MDVTIEELVELVMGEEQVLKVVSVVGFGGLGKTTLANQVYRKLEGQFECKTFVSVSQKPDIPKLLNKISLKLGGRISHTGDLDDLENIKNYLLDKRYFIVVDDLRDSCAWRIIKCAFPENNRGSRVLITTRIYDVALACCSYSKQYVYNMRPLCEENSKRLFFNRIFGSSARACPDAFDELSADILKKCGGLPLAIISIASLLSGQSYSKWEYVRNSLGSMFEGNPNLEDMMWILDLSYKNLPRQLKTCLLYIGMYPEDFIIQKDDLLRQWIAEGLVSAVHGLEAQDAGRSYFNELVNMSMIQPVKTDYNDEVVSFRVHDIMLDLIRVKSAEENFVYVIDHVNATLHNKARRVSLHHVVARGQIPKTIGGTVSQVRSFMAFSRVCMPSLEGFKYVRVLHLQLHRSHTGLQKVHLNDICGLFLLRYLKIESYGFLLELPNKLCGLPYLETIDLPEALGKVTIPSDVVRLHRLSHLIVPGGVEFLDEVGSLKSLCTLVGFDISNSSRDSVKSLGELNNLRDLEICYRGGRVDDMALDTLQTSLERLAHSSNNLRSLVLRGRRFPATAIVRSDWLSMLSPFPRKLQRLYLDIQLPRIPKWIAQLHGLYNLQLVVAKVVPKDDDIGILAGLPSLVYLRLVIVQDLEERIVIPNTSVAFPVLAHLDLRCPEPLLAIKTGALARLQNIHLVFTAVGWKEAGKWLEPVGIEHHLPSGLKKIEMFCSKEGAPDKARESALRSVCTTHHPGVDLYFPDILYYYPGLNV